MISLNHQIEIKNLFSKKLEFTFYEILPYVRKIELKKGKILIKEGV